MFRRAMIVCSLLLMAAAPLPKQLTVGIYPSYPPLDLKDPATGKLRGFDVSLGAALAARMGTKLLWQETSFAQFISSVETGRIDLFLNGMDDTSQRQRVIGFVDYLQSGTQFMVRAADAAKYPSSSSLCGKTVAGSRSTNLPGQIAAWSKQYCQKAGKTPVRFLGADNNIDARSQLKQGRADAMVQDSLTIPYVREQEPGVYQAVGVPFDMTLMGIGVGKDDVVLENALQKALQALIDDGTYDRLVTEADLPPSSEVARATIDGQHR